MSFRTTIIAAAVLAVLGAYIYKYEREPVESDLDTQREEVFSDLEADGIREITIRRPDAESLTVRKEGETWSLVEPVEAVADENEAATLARNLADLERERIIAESAEGEPLALGAYGLAEPRLEIQFDAEGENPPVTLQIGSKTPTGTNLYAKLAGEDRVFVIPSYLEQNFDKKAWDLRDKSVVDFERDEVEKIVVTSGKEQLVLAKASEDRWNVTEPVFCRADRGKASSLVSRLEFAKLDEIVTESAEDVKSFGLDRPAHEVDIQLKGGRSAKLLIGAEKDGKFHAKNPDRPMVFLISSSLVDDVTKRSSEYVSKRLFDFATYQVNRFQIQPAEGPARTFSKTEKGEEEDAEETWTISGPDSRELARRQVEDFLYKLNGTDADEVSTEAEEMGGPSWVITVWSEDGAEVEELAVSKPEGDTVLARRKDDRCTLEISASKWEEIEKLMSFEEQKEEEETPTEDEK